MTKKRGKVLLIISIFLVVSGGAWLWLNRGVTPSTKRVAGTYQTPTILFTALVAAMVLKRT